MEIIDDLRSKYNGKKVFLTGHTGFKGAWMLLFLKHIGAIVRGYALAPRSDSLYAFIQGDDFCKSVVADIRDKETLAHQLLDFQPDYVFHMAAQSLVIESYENPVETFEINAMGTVHLLDALRQLEHPCKAVIITTDKVYEQGGRARPFSENEKLGGHDPYSASKACCEFIVQSFYRSFFHSGKSHNQVKIVSARSGNVIGGGDWSQNRIVPDLVRSVQNSKPLVLRNPNSVRPWQHVLDALLGYLILGSEMQRNVHEISLSWNFAPLAVEDVTVRQVVEQLKTVLNTKIEEKIPNQNEWHEAPYLQLDARLSHEKLGWTPRLTTNLAIRWTAEWYRQVIFEKANPREICNEQISNYLKL